MALFEYLSNANLPWLVVSGLLCWLVSTTVYRLYFDPLAKFPGPKLAAITRYYEAYYDVVQRGQYTYKIEKLHKEYGPIVRISPYELHVHDPAFFGQLYRHDGNWEKYAWVQRAFAAGPRSSFITTPHDIHRRRRAPLDVLFSKANVARRQEVVSTYVNKLHRRISDAAAQGQTFDLGDALAATGTDIGTKYILGTSFDNLDRADFNLPMTNMIRAHGGMWRTMKHVTILASVLLSMPLNMLEKVSGQESREFVAFLRHNKVRVEAEMSNVSSDDVKDDTNSETLVQAILKSRQLPQSEKTLDRIIDEVDSVTSAGIETVGQTLRLTCFHVYNDPNILQRLRDELTDVSKYLGPSAAAPADKKPILSQLEQLPYLTAVIREGLRMSPGVGTRSARIAPDRVTQYGSYSIPAGTPVSMTVLLLHYDENLYPNPHTFNPDRWLGSEGNDTERVFAPFSKGTRMCVGMHLAYAELYMVIATLVVSFNIELIDAKPEDVAPSHDSFVIGTKEMHGPKARAVVL